MLKCLSAVTFLLISLGHAIGAQGTTEPLTFYPDWFPGAQFAGVYVAVDRGFYRDAGLDVKLVPFAYGQKSAQLIAANPAECGVATIEGYIFLQKRAQGDDLLALGAMLQQGPAGFMSLKKTGITTAKDFAGKTIGVHKFADPLYRWFVRQAGLAETDAKMIFVGNDLGLLTRGEVAAMQGFATEEFVQFKKIAGDQATFLSFAEMGFDSYSQIITTNSTQVKIHRAALHRFLVATRRGWQDAFTHPDQAVSSIHTRIGADCDDVFQHAALAALVDYVSPGGTEPMAALNPVKLKKLEETCVDIGFLHTAEPVENFLVDVENPGRTHAVKGETRGDRPRKP